MQRTIVDFHVLQTVPPSNINRDESGSPKTAFFGGARRARVSSQAWKHATRKEFPHLVDVAKLSKRTLRVVELVANAILARDPECPDAEKRAAVVMAAAGVKVAAPKGNKEGTPQSGYLMFVSQAQAERLAELALDETLDPKELKGLAQGALREDQGIDIALFGRMVADDKSLGVDASCQVAHALSVDAVAPEFDYYTAVDDLNRDDESGAGMIGTIEFNSSTLYRYATLDVDALHATLGDPGATVEAAGAFLEAFVRSMPTGKQNTFANRTLPEGVVVMVRETQPINLVQAFEEPVEHTSTSGRVHVACERLVQEAQAIVAAYGETPVATFVLAKGERTAPLRALADPMALADLRQAVGSLIAERLAMTSDD